MDVQEALYVELCEILGIDSTLTAEYDNKKINKSVTVLHKEYLLDASREARRVINRSAVASKVGLMMSIYNRKIKEHQVLMLLIQLFEIAMRTQAAIVLSRKFSTSNSDDWYWQTSVPRNHQRLKSKISNRARTINQSIVPTLSTIDMFHMLTMGDIQDLYQRNWSSFRGLFNNSHYKGSEILALHSHAMFNARFERIRKYRNNLYHGNPGNRGWRQIINDIEDILVQLHYNLEDAINNIDPNHNIVSLRYQYN